MYFNEWVRLVASRHMRQYFSYIICDSIRYFKIAYRWIFLSPSSFFPSASRKLYLSIVINFHDMILFMKALKSFSCMPLSTQWLHRFGIFEDKLRFNMGFSLFVCKIVQYVLFWCLVIAASGLWTMYTRICKGINVDLKLSFKKCLSSFTPKILGDGIKTSFFFRSILSTVPTVSICSTMVEKCMTFGTLLWFY